MPMESVKTLADAKTRANTDTLVDAPGSGFQAVGETSPVLSSLQERRPRTLKHSDTFAVFDTGGDALAGPGSPDGLYHRDTRYLSHFSIAFGDQHPLLLSSTLRDDNVTLTCDLTNPDIFDADGRLVLRHDLIHVRRSRFLWNGTCFERLLVRNFDLVPQRFRLTVRFAADFADLFEVRGSRRAARGESQPPEVGPSRVTLAYHGLDGRWRRTQLSFDPAPQRLTGTEASFDIEVPPHENRIFFLEIRCDGEPSITPVRRAFFHGLREARRALRATSGRAAGIATSNDIFNEAVRRSVSDLYMLVTETGQGPYPYAGIPWFSTVFGRDAIITALEALWLDPAIARGVLRYLAAEQATAFDAEADAEPGKILHEVRHGEMAELKEVPFRRYYGSIDATPLFVLLAGAYLDRTGDLETIRALWPNIAAALRWIDAEGDRDGDGFVEYGRRTDQGLINQGWKDSHDSVFHADGSIARGPIALAEVQAYVYAAWQAAARITAALGRRAEADTYAARAASLRERFDRAFFLEDLGTYALALDGDKRPCRIRASNAGHVLFTGLALPERAGAVAGQLMESSSFSGWGIRTVAAGEARYNPMSYHNGSVWPHDNALIAAGLARYGRRRDAARILEGLFAASSYLELRRLPELFCGFPRQFGNGPTFYPVACAPQAWAAGAPLMLIQTCLGLTFDMAAGEIIFDQPVLPDFIDEIVLKGLVLGEASVDVAVRGVGPEVGVNVLRRSGDVRVVTRS